jgi:hypothetical protein
MSVEVAVPCKSPVTPRIHGTMKTSGYVSYRIVPQTRQLNAEVRPVC